jgi:hypothetical protein
MPIRSRAPSNEPVVEAHRLIALAKVGGADMPWASCRSLDETLV